MFYYSLLIRSLENLCSRREISVLLGVLSTTSVPISGSIEIINIHDRAVLFEVWIKQQFELLAHWFKGRFHSLLGWLLVPSRNSRCRLLEESKEATGCFILSMIGWQ